MLFVAGQKSLYLDSPQKLEGAFISGREDLKKAKTAVARKLAVILHCIWVDGYRVPMGQGESMIH